MYSFSPEGSDVTVTVDPVHGGRVVQLRIGDRDLLVDADQERPLTDQVMTWGSFPMAPWAGRLRHGRFELGGRQYRLPPNLPPHAAHGTVFAREWDVVLIDDHEIELSTDLSTERSTELSTESASEGGWVLGGTAHQRIAIDHASLWCELSVDSGAEPMPAELGWHPWFHKPERMSFTPEAMYVRDTEGIPTGELVPPPPGPWDDCFVGGEPIVLHYDGLDLTLTSDCDHWVVFDQPLHATCVEPQSGPPDAFNLRPRVLAPGERLTRWYRWAWAVT